MKDVIDLLAAASAAVSAVGIKSNAAKMRKQLLLCAMELRNLAVVLRRGEVRIAETAVDDCVSELNDVLAVSKTAKNEEGYGRVLAEALEAIAVVEEHLVAKVDSDVEAAMMLSSRALPIGLTPVHPDLLPPRIPMWPRRPRGWPTQWPWPPRPNPPWPPEPPPWWDDIPGWGRGFPR